MLTYITFNRYVNLFIILSLSFLRCNYWMLIRLFPSLNELIAEHGPTRDDVIAWAKNEVRLETEKYKNEQETKAAQITFHADRKLDYGQQRFFQGGYLFAQSIYYGLRLDKTCRKIKSRHKYQFDLNAILSDLIYNRILDPQSKESAYHAAQEFLEPPSYELHDVYRALSILAAESDFIQSEVFKNSNFLEERNSRILYYDCSNFYFEIEQEDGMKKYGKSKEQTSLKPLEAKILQQFGCDKFIYCSDAVLASQANRNFNHMGKRAFIVTQSIKKLRTEDKAVALNKDGFKRLSDNRKITFEDISDDGSNKLYYKEIPYVSGNLDQRLIVTYSPKYAAYQQAIRQAQVDRAKAMLENGNLKKNRKNPNDPARFIGKGASTKDGEVADIHYYPDESKVAEEAKYDGLYAVSTDLLDDEVKDILKVSEERWQIEECFRIMKTDFSARPIYVQREDRIKAHFLICFLALLSYHLLEKQLDNKYTCEEILKTMKEMNFVDLEGQGFTPTYIRNKLTDDLHKTCGFDTDFQFISKSKMKEIEKKSKRR